MTDTIAVTGLVATTPKHLVTGAGLSITSFRLASQQRRYDRAEQKWVDGDTNWYTVATFRQLANNVISSVQKGQRIAVIGRLKVRDWSTDEKQGTSIEIEAEALGHDLSWGTAAFTRSAAAATAVSEPDDAAAAVEPGDAGVAVDDDHERGPEPDTSVAPERETAGVSTPF